MIIGVLAFIRSNAPLAETWPKGGRGRIDATANPAAQKRPGSFMSSVPNRVLSIDSPPRSFFVSPAVAASAESQNRIRLQSYGGAVTVATQEVRRRQPSLPDTHSRDAAEALRLKRSLTVNVERIGVSRPGWPPDGQHRLNTPIKAIYGKAETRHRSDQRMLLNTINQLAGELGLPGRRRPVH